MADKRDQNFVPKNYEELYLHYINGANSLCRSILRSKLPKFEETEREALAHEAYLRLQRHQAIERFNPEKGNFGGLIFAATRSVIGNWMNQRQRDPMIMDNDTGLPTVSVVSSIKDEDDFEPGTISLETLFTEDPRMEVKTEAARRVRKMAEYAKNCTENPSHKRDRNMWPLFQLLLAGCDPQECAETLKVTNSTIHNWIGVLRLQADM